MALTKRAAAYAPVILVYCLALFVRIVYNLTVARGYIPIYDAALYDKIGHNLASLHCYCLYPPLPNVSRPPLWPFVMSIIDIFAGGHEFYLRLFYCFLGSGTCVLVYLFAKDLFGERIALVTGIIAAIYTGLFIYDGWLYTESLYDFCLTAFAYSLYRLQKAAPQQGRIAKSSLTFFQSLRQYMVRGRWVVLCGILLGLISLTRPNGPILLGLLFIWAVIVTLTKILPRQVVIKDTLIIAAIGILILAPWTYRNYAVTGRLILVSTGVGEVLKGVYDDAVVSGDPSIRGMWRPPPNSVNHDNIKYTPQDDAIDTQTALTWIRGHLSEMPYLLTLHFTNMWIPYDYVHGLPMEEFPTRLSSKLLMLLIPLMSIPIFFMAFLGLLFTWKRRKQKLLVVYLVMAFIIAQNIVFYSNMRFRAPIEPFLVLLTGGLLWWLTSDQPGTLRARFKKTVPGQINPLPAGGDTDSDTASRSLLI